MTIYVDKSRNSYGRMKMAHMLADALDELHAMADRLGLKREWFQNHGTPHYDLCQSKREQAIRFGAVVVDRSRVVELIRHYRSMRANQRDGWAKRAHRSLAKEKWHYFAPPSVVFGDLLERHAGLASRYRSIEAVSACESWTTDDYKILHQEPPASPATCCRKCLAWYKAHNAGVLG
jgi:hypothetical protein